MLCCGYSERERHLNLFLNLVHYVVPNRQNLCCSRQSVICVLPRVANGTKEIPTREQRNSGISPLGTGPSIIVGFRCFLERAAFPNAVWTFTCNVFEPS
ncbi:hypothetical protein TNIN_302821 [Trichonephila inaurata madagascariensis]|uniref:Uncharacterized protein n=1 Tax=Trichonephila inaurata madagascariensis TaxID=2747483 RepID=A0A8X6WS06_9ARAC|nr:hypothetical protein TNIN_302821 [Trichonephila inaurata madagascariensis]